MQKHDGLVHIHYSLAAGTEVVRIGFGESAVGTVPDMECRPVEVRVIDILLLDAAGQVAGRSLAAAEAAARMAADTAEVKRPVAEERVDTKMLETVGVVGEENMEVVTSARGSVAAQEAGLQVDQLGPDARTCSYLNRRMGDGYGQHCRIIVLEECVGSRPGRRKEWSQCKGLQPVEEEDDGRSHDAVVLRKGGRLGKEGSYRGTWLGRTRGRTPRIGLILRLLWLLARLNRSSVHDSTMFRPGNDR